MAVLVSSPTERDLPELADVAARTFPLACPPSVTPDNIAAFIAENLTQTRFAEYLTDPERVVLTARCDGLVLGYAMLIRGVVDDADVQRAVPLRPAVELSKMYVLPGGHGSGVSAALMAATLEGQERSAPRACGSGSTRKTNAPNGSTPNTAWWSAEPRRSGWATESRTTT
jgi:GNAT superfamily N-acetyltransferase